MMRIGGSPAQDMASTLKCSLGPTTESAAIPNLLKILRSQSVLGSEKKNRFYAS
jgi:hypothetical protein